MLAFHADNQNNVEILWIWHNIFLNWLTLLTLPAEIPMDNLVSCVCDAKHVFFDCAILRKPSPAAFLYAARSGI